MDEIIPWDEWVGVIEPYYPKGKRGRPPMGIEKMLRMYLLQIWFNLSDPATEDAVYDSYAMRKFTGIDFLKESVPDETTLCKFRHLLEVNGLNKLFFEAINRVMVQSGYMMKGGTIVDATIIDAPSSIKNAEKARDPEMHQTRKGNEWRFGMKCHVGVDAGSGLVHTITVTSANKHDNRPLPYVGQGLFCFSPSFPALGRTALFRHNSGNTVWNDDIAECVFPDVTAIVEHSLNAAGLNVAAKRILHTFFLEIV